LAWNNAHEVNSRVKVNLWLANPRVYLCVEQLALNQWKDNVEKTGMTVNMNETKGNGRS